MAHKNEVSGDKNDSPDHGEDFNLTITVDKDPMAVFAAVNDVRHWWSGEIEGDTDRLGAEFKYHYRDVHRCAFIITAFDPGKKVAWHVRDNHFNFTKGQDEWIGTDVVFDIAAKGKQTELRFRHRGLLPRHECYAVCSDAWTSYIRGSLRDLIMTGTGNPNPIEEVVAAARVMSRQDFSLSVDFAQSPAAVFAAVKDVRAWWSEEIEGASGRIGDSFVFRYQDLHRSTHTVSDFIPAKKLVWTVTDSHISFVPNHGEWNGTAMVFEIEPSGGRTLLTFTHAGLVPALACYQDCAEGWRYFITESLRKLVEEGKGEPERKPG